MIKFRQYPPYDACVEICRQYNTLANACDLPEGEGESFDFSKCPGYQFAKTKSYIPDLTLSQEKEV